MRVVALHALLALALPTGAIAAEPMTSAEQDLDCAVITAIVAGQATPEDRSGLGVLMAHYVGLYEGKTGRVADDAFAVRTAALTQDEIKALLPTCQQRSVAFAERLQKLGQRMTAQGN